MSGIYYLTLLLVLTSSIWKDRKFLILLFLDFSAAILICWRRKWHPTLVLLPGKSHGRRSLIGYSLWGRKESDTTERLHFTPFTHFILYHWRRKWQPTPVFLPGESHGQRSLAGHGAWGCRESDTTEVTEHILIYNLKGFFEEFLFLFTFCVTLISLKINTSGKCSRLLYDTWSFCVGLTAQLGYSSLSYDLCILLIYAFCNIL